MIHVLLLALAPTFFVMALGWGAGRSGNINNMHVDELNTVVMGYCLPASLFVATASSKWSELIAQWPILLSLAIVMMGTYVIWFAYQRHGRDQDSSESALQSLAVGQPNYAAAAFPVVTALFGAEHLSTVAVGIAVGSLLPSPLTLALLELDQHTTAATAPAAAKSGRPCSSAATKEVKVSGWSQLAKASRHALSKPIVLAPVFGTAISMAGWHLPDAVAASLRQIGVAAGGMGLFVTGLVLSESRFRLTFNTALGVAVSNIAQPIIAFMVCRVVGASVEITKLSVVMAALPSGFFGILFGNSYHRLSSEANSTIIASTIFSAVSLAATIAWTYSWRGWSPPPLFFSSTKGELHMSRTILITGAGSGLGEGAAIGLARKGHTVIATAETWPQVTALRDKVAAQELRNISVTRLNLLDEHDLKHAAKLDFDVLVNNAGVGEGGPISEIPMDLVRNNFEINVFALLDLTQRVVRNWVKSRTRGKVVFISSILGVVSPGMVGTYSATKHAVQAIAEAMQDELREFGIQVQTINPGPFFTGFNERMVEAAYRWLDDEVNFTTRASFKAQTDALLDKPEMRLNPDDMVARMVELIPESSGPFRTIFPQETADWAQAAGQAMLERQI